MGRTENNHTAFIRIRTNRTSLKQGPLEAEEGEFLMLPVEVEVSSGKNIFICMTFKGLHAMVASVF